MKNTVFIWKNPQLSGHWRGLETSPALRVLL